LKKVVILGAGYAGVLTAKKLAKQVKKRKLEDIEITIVDRNPFHTMLTELHEVAAQRVEEDSIRISLQRVFAGRKVNVVQDTITEMDFERQTITGASGALPYDYLVLSSGSKPTFYGTPGAEEFSFTLWSYDDAIRLREHVMDMFRAAGAETDPEKKRELLTFYVVGLGFTGVEMMGELAELAPFLCDRFEIDPALVTMVDVDMLEKACTVMPDRLGAKVVRRLEKMGVQVRFKTNIKGVGADYIEFDRNQGKGLEREKTHTVIWTAGVEGSSAAQASKDLGAAGRGRIQTDEFLRAQNYKNVYVGGDNIYFVPEGEKAPVAQMVEVAEASADTIAHNLMTDLTKTGEKEKFAPKFHGVMVCVGGRYGVAYVGTVNHKLALASFFAMFTKHFMNVIYFVKVLGWHKVYSYLRHEFFTVRNKRSFVGGHFSNRGPSFFGVPLRMFLGAFWLYEAIKKMTEGWMIGPRLADSINGASAFFHNAIAGAQGAAAAAAPAVTAAADATASATSGAAAGGGGAAAAVPVLLNWNLWLVHPILTGGGSASEVAFQLKVPVINWFLNLFLPSNTMQMIMQITIVLLEVLIGAALIGGLFTTPAGIGSFALQMMFVTTTGLYMDTWWMVFASIAVLCGAGRVFSLDYYVQPWLKKHWSRTKLARKSYLYHD